MDQNLIDILNEAGIIASDIEEPHCGYRCPSHDAEVGGVNGQHPRGTAADVGVDRFDSVEQLAELFESLNADGVGRYPGEMGEFVHVDVRSGRVGDTYRW
jgi:uncharacterized protein YcbK (DUF882 family)